MIGRWQAKGKESAFSAPIFDGKYREHGSIFLTLFSLRARVPPEFYLG